MAWGKKRAELECSVQEGVYTIPPDKSSQACMLSLTAHVPAWSLTISSNCSKNDS